MQRALLVALDVPGRRDGWSARESLDELARLAETAGAQVAGRAVQRREGPDPATFIGEGKLQEVEGQRQALGCELVIFDHELSPVQQRNLEKVIQSGVVDRTALILDIFAQRARSREAMLQVELAQLNYMLPRLTGRGVALSRLGGGIGTRGPGETKLEVDRRRIRARVAQLRRDLEEVRAHRRRLRQERQRRHMPVVALCGYTNAGKSTLLNALTGAGVLAEDRLFATLDATARRVAPASGEPYLLVDTVGFIQHLPHQLVAAFRSTLEEVTEADVLVHVVDASHAKREEQMHTVTRVLSDLGAGEKPAVLAFNKVDLLDESGEASALVRRHAGAVAIAAAYGRGLDELQAAIQRELAARRRIIEVLVPYRLGWLSSLLHERGKVLAEEHTPEGVRLRAEVDRALAAQVEGHLEPPGEGDAQSTSA